MFATITPAPVTERVDALPWDELTGQLDERGFAVTGRCWPPASAGRWPICSTAAASARRSTWRATASATAATATSITRCPDPIAPLRGAFYRHLAPIANEWSALLGGDADAFPLEHEELLERCRAAGQERPTPLILRYGAGDWNALHQDLYGDVYFPFQVLTVLSEPGVDYEGGEFVLLEQRPRAQSRAHVVTAAARRVRGLPDPAAPRARQARLLQGRPAPRRQHGHRAVAHGARDHLPRRPLTKPRAENRGWGPNAATVRRMTASVRS